MKVVGLNSIIGWTFFQIIFVVKIVIFGRKYEKMNAADSYKWCKFDRTGEISLTESIHRT